MPKQLRIVYAIGLVEDVIEAYEAWKKGEDVASQVSTTFSGHFYDVCTALNAFGYIIAEGTAKVVRDDRFIIERRPIILSKAKGVFYHLRQILRGLQLLVSAIKFGADVVIADSGTTYWFVLLLFPWFGIQVIPSLHCTLWRKYSNQTLGEQIALKLSYRLFSSKCHSIHAVSQDIAEQITQLTKGTHRPMYEFLPIYRRSDFYGISPPSLEHKPLRVLFAGRVEYEKGVFDLLEIAKQIASNGLKNIVFDICGDGTALKALRISVENQGVENLFRFYGYCNKQQMQEMFGKSYTVIVPTRTDFIEGFNRVIAESVLSGRPVITSAVCPALSYVREAVIEVPPNDIEAYAQAVLELYNNPAIYEEKRLACLKLQEQFYDIDRSWAAALNKSLLAIQE